jgi:hypothetical protein
MSTRAGSAPEDRGPCGDLDAVGGTLEQRFRQAELVARALRYVRL